MISVALLLFPGLGLALLGCNTVAEFVTGAALTYTCRSSLSSPLHALAGNHSARPPRVILSSRTASEKHSAFSTAGPTIWNNFPPELRCLPRDLSGSFYGLFL